jgi:colanic acid biosynthesis glycosyl transferase WcaI
MKIVVVTPHFVPDVAPTGEVVTRITHELAALGHRIEVVTSLPWYRQHRVEPGFDGRLVRYEDTPWGRITRVHPFPTADKRKLLRRALGFVSFSSLIAALGAHGGDVDGVLAVSPPLTLALSGWAIARARRAPFVFNVQDVYPDVAVELGVLTNRSLVAAARRLERLCYGAADAITVLSRDIQDNVADKVVAPDKVRIVPNFVDTEFIAPMAKENPYRRQFGLEHKTVVMYAGNIGLSQSVDLLIDAAAALAHDDQIVFVINGDGAARPQIERRARGLKNVVFVDLQPVDRLPEVLAAADVHVIPLKRGLGRASVPSKTYSILAAARPVVASIDPGSEIAEIVSRSGAGIAVPPEDVEAFTKAIRALVESPDEAAAMGRAGRSFVGTWGSPRAVALAYERLFAELRHR